MSDIPDGFEPLYRTSPFMDLLGPFYNKITDSGLVLAVRAENKHCNARGIVHGGLLSALADVSLGHNAAFHKGEAIPLVTASLSIDFAGSAKLGDWIETETMVQKVGRTMAFANCYFLVAEKRIARASCVFGVKDA